MTTQKHAPGPWVADVSNQPIIVNGPDDGRGSNIVAIVYDEECKNDYHYPVEAAAANARLIAAAPEQHEALCCAPTLSAYHSVNGFELEKFIADYEAWGEKKRAAIAKARGESAEVAA